MASPDPANDTVPYEAAVDIQELVQVEEVMAMQGVGPNGALVFCMELLEANITWLINKLKKLPKHYLIFDFPGQVCQLVYSTHYYPHNCNWGVLISTIVFCHYLSAEGQGSSYHALPLFV